MKFTRDCVLGIPLQAVPVLYNSLGALSPSELVALVGAYSTAGAYQQELYAALSEFLWEALSELEPAEVAEVAWSYAVVGHYDDDEDLFNKLADAAASNVQVCEKLRSLKHWLMLASWK
jgi:hypothetical protein